MGVGQLLYKQWAKGILYILLQAAFIVYLVMAGAADFFGLFTLGSVAANPWYGIEGDHSVIMMLRGMESIEIVCKSKGHFYNRRYSAICRIRQRGRLAES